MSWLDEYRWLEGLVASNGSLFPSLVARATASVDERIAALDAERARYDGIADPARFTDPPQKAAAQRLVAEIADRYTAAVIEIDPSRAMSAFAVAAAPTPAMSGSFVVTTGRGTFRVDAPLADGDLSTVYAGKGTAGELLGEDVAVKVATDAADNDLLFDEITTLRLLGQGGGPQVKQLPSLVDSFKTADGRAGTILRVVEGKDLVGVRERYAQGIPAEHVVWIIRRLLSVAGYAHSQGVIHGNIEPAHVMIRGRDHMVTLIDWTASIIAPGKTGKGFKIFNPDYSAPEVAEKKSPIPASDLYSIGKVARYALGDAINSVDDRLVRFIDHLCRDSPLQRAQDAWEMFELLGRVRQDVFGQHQFVPFDT
jgi:serine/threonine protein kinase